MLGYRSLSSELTACSFLSKYQKITNVKRFPSSVAPRTSFLPKETLKRGSWDKPKERCVTAPWSYEVALANNCPHMTVWSGRGAATINRSLAHPTSWGHKDAVWSTWLQCALDLSWMPAVITILEIYLQQIQWLDKQREEHEHTLM